MKNPLNTNKLPSIAFFMIFSGTALAAQQAQTPDIEELTGTPKLACEALLCLSSSTRPDECSPSINEYFSIKEKKWSDTLDARRDFLNKCPASNEEGMPALVDAIVNGAGQCDADTLNSHTITKTRKVCTHNIYSFVDSTCHTETYTVISNVKPQVCSEYENNAYTDISVTYVGDPEDGGHWVNSEDYEKELQALHLNATQSATPQSQSSTYSKYLNERYGQ